MADRSLFDVFQQDEAEYAEEIADAIEEDLSGVNKDFFTLLVAKAFGKPNMPEFAHSEFMDGTGGALPWHDLSDKYVAWKQKHGKGSNFYSKDRRLSKFLFNLDPDAMLGEPQVDLDMGQEYLAPQPAQASVRVKVRSKASPGFAPVDEIRIIAGKPAVPAQVARPPSIEIRAMPLMDGYSNIEERMFGLGESIMPNKDAAYKLTGPRGLHLRPLLTPYLNWYYQTLVQAKINSILENFT